MEGEICLLKQFFDLQAVVRRKGNANASTNNNRVGADLVGPGDCVYKSLRKNFRFSGPLDPHLNDCEFVAAQARYGIGVSDRSLQSIRNALSRASPTHGMRSAFKVWCAEVAKARDEVSEAALAHTIPEKVRAAYLRTDFLEERKALMGAWAKYCAKKMPASRTRGSHAAA